MRPTLPKLYTRLFKAFCKPHIYQELQGDLEEEFYFNSIELGEAKAKSIYRKEILKMLRPSVIRKPKIIINMFNTSLFQIHLKLAFRNLWRNKVFSAINVFGLAAAITVSMFALNIIYTGLSVDSQHPHKERLYRVVTKIEKTIIRPQIVASTSPPLGEKLRADVPEIEVLTHFRSILSSKETINGSTITLNKLLVDEDFFKVFYFKVISGNTDVALNDKSGVIITDDLANRFFPNDNPLGKRIGNGGIIDAVIESPKGLSHLNFDLITVLPENTNCGNGDETNPKRWENYFENYTYLRSTTGVSQEQLDEKLKRVSAEVNLLKPDQKSTFDYRTQKVDKIMFGEQVFNNPGLSLGKGFLYVLITLISILLLLASFNYTNLSIAGAIQRTKEMGIRKVAGSTRPQIIGQILVETIIFSILATLVAYLLYMLFMPEFAAMMSTSNLLFDPNSNTILLLTFLGFSVIVGLVAGLFPALYFARISPLQAFRSNIKSKTMSLMNIRKALVGFQLTISMFCIMVMVAGSDLYNSILQNDWNFEQQGVINVEVAAKNRQLLKSQYEQVAGVTGVSAVSSLPGVGTMGMTVVKSFDGTDSLVVNFSVVDSDFKKVFEPKLFAGNDFSRPSSDSTLTEVWVNRKLLNDFKIPLESALGYTLSVQKNIARYQVIGVMEDLLFDRLDEPSIPPTLVAHEKIELYPRSLAIRVATNDLTATLSKLEKATKEVDAEQAFTPVFLNNVIEDSYSGLYQINQLFTFLSIIIISISLLGQVGIALYNAETRTKEIGIRKVLGARVKSIIIMLLKGTLITLGISTLIAAPLAYLFFNETFWNMTVAETSNEAIVLAKGILLLGGLVIFIVIIQTWRVAKANPTESLRSE